MWGLATRSDPPAGPRRRDRRWHDRALVLVALALLAACPDLAAQVLLDRVLALVDEAIVTLSDVQASLALGLVRPPAEGDPLRVALDRAIERQLLLNEVERYSSPEPDPAYIDLRLAVVRARFPDAEAYQAALARAGLDEPALRAVLRDDLRIEQYLRDRFSAVIQPTEEETRQYYLEHQAAFTRDDRVLPYEDVIDEITEALVERRRDEVIADWLERLRRRSIVSDFYEARAGTGGKAGQAR